MDGNGADWAASGLAWLTGLPEGPPDHSRAAVLARAESVAADLTEHLGVPVDAAATLAGRAAQLGLQRQGQVSAGGATRLMPTRDGWWALTLSRPDDIAAVAALVESDSVPDDPWPVIADWATQRRGEDVVDRAALLGLPGARLGETTAQPPQVRPSERRGAPRTAVGLLVVDLSSMWAGPLCSRILAAGGATVVDFKVEVPGKYMLVDHSLSRANRGLVGILDVEGPENPAVFKPHQKPTKMAEHAH